MWLQFFWSNFYGSDEQINLSGARGNRPVFWIEMIKQHVWRSFTFIVNKCFRRTDVSLQMRFKFLGTNVYRFSEATSFAIFWRTKMKLLRIWFGSTKFVEDAEIVFGLQYRQRSSSCVSSFHAFFIQAFFRNKLFLKLYRLYAKYDDPQISEMFPINGRCNSNAFQFLRNEGLLIFLRQPILLCYEEPK